MIINDITISEQILFGMLLIAGTVLPTYAVRNTNGSVGPREGRKVPRDSGPSLLTIGAGLLVLGLLSGPVQAKEIFAIPSNGGYEFYQLDGSIQDPLPSERGTSAAIWPSLQSGRLDSDFSFTDSRVKESPLLVNPGYRTSLTNRIITVAGRIAWDPGFVEINLINPLDEQGTFDISKLNIERLTGVYEMAWVFNNDLKGNGYN